MRWGCVVNMLGCRAFAAGLVASAAVVGSASGALAGDLIADLADIGYASSQDSQLDYQVEFVAGDAKTTIAFAFLAQPGIEFSDVSLFDATTKSTNNLIFNGNFAESGKAGSGSPNGWSVQVFSAGGHVLGRGWVPSSKCQVFSTCWYDDIRGGSENAISQTVSTTAGDTYSLSFSASIDGGDTSLSPWSSSVDILTYVSDWNPPVYCQPVSSCLAGNLGAPIPTPEPSTWVMMLLGLAGLGLAGHHRSKSLPTAGI